MRLPAEPGSARRARELLREVLSDADRLDCLDAAELACTELVTNAVLHAHTEMDVTVEVGDRVRVAVRDFNPMPPLQRHYGVQATTGRGLALVAAVSDEHGVDDAGPGGKTMWFTVGGPVVGSDGEVRTAWDTAVWDTAAWDTAAWDTAGRDTAGRDVDAGEAGRTVASGTQQQAVLQAGTRTVRLLRLPPTLWLAAREHHDALLRELAFYRARHELAVDLAAADRVRSTISAGVMAVLEAAQRAGEVRSVLPSGHPSPLPWVPAPFDLDIDVPDGMGADAAALQDALDAAEQLAQAGKLLARPGLPEVVAIRDWACEQIQAQLAGVEPAPWTGTDHDRFVQDVDLEGARQLEAFTAAVRGSDRRVVAADDANRIIAVSASLADTLGWQADELVGRRIVALVPPRLREAHVAGFTRHLTTGQAHVLGVPLTLSVLRADGTEVDCHFLIDRTRPVPGRSMYVAWIDPVEPA